ncbi:murein biosynthesis integral membrane protein MurJ [Borrelia anserina]|uniref:Probable lipid II flippase MurJ n=2 Tax=Borrelia anserina TaxID=143 RepID=W5SUQ5_BORAN|nr:murein biosynthesis integral membrane protein MurJ [Borrelia anserina]AHH08781.1 Virulence factor mviN [Borrelia anserina BA2]APR65228.1 multidrug transporter MurJ [Borrelia anserina Es]UPA07154.1 murein biosynthesis integral membrane protein MurJ [Borrelia anserina]
MNRDIISAVIVMISIFFSRVMGFIRIKVFSYYFGANLEADIFNYVFNIPNNLRKIISEGAMTSAFIPEFTCEKNKSNKHAINFFRLVVTFSIVSIGFIICILILFSRQIMYFLSSYRGSHLDLASCIFNYLILYVLLISLASIFASALNSYKFFFIPSFSPVLFSLSIILSIYFFYRQYGIYSAVVGVIFGGILQFLVQMVNCIWIGFIYRPIFNFNDSAFLRFLKRWIHIILSALVTVVTQQISFALASTLDVGSVSVLSNAIVYYQLPVGIFYVSISTVIFPKMAEYASLGNKKGLNAILNQGIDILIFILVPISFLMYIWAGPILNLLLTGGKFSVYDTQRTVGILQYFLVGLPFYSIFGLFQKYYFSVHNSRIPLYFNLLFASIDIAISVFGLKFYKVDILPIAQSISFALCVVIFYFVGFKIGMKLELIRSLVALMKAFISLFPLYLFYALFRNFNWDVGFSFSNFFLLSVVGAVNIIILTLCYYLLGVISVFKFIGREIT